ncbi:hypothetical protein DVH05_022291 [Phytophthora capsici]|nr:hypothetical protein DVH05_022291 [Phytophthora capsici]
MFGPTGEDSDTDGDLEEKRPVPVNAGSDQEEANQPEANQSNSSAANVEETMPDVAGARANQCVQSSDVSITASTARPVVDLQAIAQAVQQLLQQPTPDKKSSPRRRTSETGMQFSSSDDEEVLGSVYIHVLHSSRRYMPSEPKSNLHIKKHYVRMTFGQKITLCEMAHNNAAQRDVQALREWAARAFDLPQLPSAASIYEVLRNEKKYRAYPRTPID